MGTRSWQGKLGAEAPMALTVFPAEVPHANHWYGDGGQVMWNFPDPGWSACVAPRGYWSVPPTSGTVPPCGWRAGCAVS
jgi:hypothetical protein